MYCCFDFFFFSSRRRHTRLVSDWSSDVCYSDLQRIDDAGAEDRDNDHGEEQARQGEQNIHEPHDRDVEHAAQEAGEEAEQIGRASCRERVEISVVAGALKKKKENKVEEDRE